MATPEATVIIATRDRVASLERTLDCLRRQRTTVAWELIVVDDGSRPPVPEDVVDGLPGGRVLRGEGRGQAVARNLGLGATRGALIVFTDDDTEPDPGWLQAAAEFLERHPDHVGVEGPVQTLPYDRLYAHSVSTDAPGSYLTANIAFRRDVLAAIGGFYEGFPALHCEDVDLAYRAMEHGPIGWAPAMRVAHHPREQTLRQLARRGRMHSSEIVLLRRHPDRFGRAARLPARLFPIASGLAYWRVLAAERRGSPRRTARAAALAVAHMANVLAAVMRPGAGRRAG